MASLTTVNNILLAEQVEEQIYNLILEQQLKPGDKIPSEHDLVIKLNVGRSTVREAVKILSSRGVVVTKQGSGTYVKELVPDSLDPLKLRDIEDKLSLAMDLVDLRMILEPGIAELAAYNATEEETDELVKICDTVDRKILAGEYYIDDDIKLHVAISKCTRNKVIEQIIFVVETAVLMFVNVTHKKLTKETIETHRAVVDAICAHDPIGARSAMTMHIAYNRSAIRRLYMEDKKNDAGNNINT